MEDQLIRAELGLGKKKKEMHSPTLVVLVELAGAGNSPIKSDTKSNILKKLGSPTEPEASTAITMS